MVVASAIVIFTGIMILEIKVIIPMLPRMGL